MSSLSQPETSPSTKKRKLQDLPPSDSPSKKPTTPFIHPSRLRSNPILRSSVKAPKEKTKAKKRYLRTKKDKRKARKKAQPKNPKLNDAAADLLDSSGVLPEEEELLSLEKAQKRKPKQKQQQHQDESDSDEGSDSDSSSDSDVDSTSDNDSDDDKESQKDQPTSQETQPQGLLRLPYAGIKKASDPELINALGLPQGLSNRTVVNPTLSRPLDPSKPLLPPPPPPTATTATITSSPSEKPAEPAETDVNEGEQSVADGEQQPSDRGEAAEDQVVEVRKNDDFARVSISQSVRQRLESLGVTEWFAVQVSVIPSLLALPHSRSLYSPYTPPRDLCVSAPTGSGKTLAYSVPIVEVLRTRTIVRLRALIVLPTRDLVSQVRSTLELIAKGTGLRIGTATGHHSFSHEQAQIMNSGKPQIDILIATPGRLIDHLDTTPGFTLSHLRFLVIDEADRLLSQSFQEWLRKVLEATEDRHASSATALAEVDRQTPLGLTCRTSLEAEAPYRCHPAISNAAIDLGEPVYPSVQKLLFSATLTRNPAKIAALGLRQPHYITIQDPTSSSGMVDHQSFSLPHSLREHMLVTAPEDKPLQLLYLLHRTESPIRKAIAFTKSVDSARRLVKLVELFEDIRIERKLSTTSKLLIGNYSSELSNSDRQRLLQQFVKGQVDVLVCSDLISRGIDLPTVEHVISYDVPVDSAKYVHRVGRTARAGKEGDAWTLVESQEVRHFKTLLNSITRHTPIDKVKVKQYHLDPWRSCYESALERLAIFFRNNNNNNNSSSASASASVS